jgi:hypothetical protein
MIDTMIEIRSTDRENLVMALKMVIWELEELELKTRGAVSKYNYDAVYTINQVQGVN